MIKKIIIIILFSFSTIYIFAQKSKLDSLLNEINICVDDSCKTYVVKNIFWHCVNNDIDTVNILLDEYLEYFTKQKFDLGITYTAQAISYIYFNNEEYSNAIEILDSVYFLISSSKYKRIVLMDLAEKNRNMKHFENSRDQLLEAIILLKEEKDTTILSKAYNRLAATFFEMDSLETVLKYVDSSLFIAEKENLQWIIANNYEIMGAVYHARKEFEKSVDYYTKAIKINNEIGAESSLANNYNNIGIAYFSLQNYKSAILYLKQASELNKNNGNQYMLLTSLNFIARAYAKTEKFELAYFYNDSAMSLRVSLFDQEKLSNVTELNKKFNHEKQEILISQQNKIIKQNHIILNQQKRQKYGVLLLLLIAIVFISFLYLLQKKIKSKSKKLYNQKEELDILNQKLFANFLKADEQNKIINTSKQQLENQNTELKKLSRYRELNTQMIVHDLKNPLNRIVSTTKQQDNQLHDSAQFMLNLVENILNLSKIEQNIFSVDLQQISINDVVKSSYKATEFLFTNKGVNFKTNLINKITVLADFEILKRVFINLFTNAVKYTKSGGNIFIDFKIIDSNIQISVKDNGIGIKKDKITEIFNIYNNDTRTKSKGISSTGIGLFFVKKAIEAHNSKILVESNKNGTSFIFQLKIVKNSNLKSSNIIETKKTTLVLDKNESEYLKPFIKDLNETEIFEVSKIKQIINQIENKTINIKLWRENLLLSVTNYNTTLFEKLLKM